MSPRRWVGCTYEWSSVIQMLLPRRFEPETNWNSSDDDRCETRIFEIDFHPTIIYYPNDYQTSHRVISSPDTVIGLKMTDEYEELAKSCLQNLIHCRVGRMSMLYPFIIIESSSSSFRSMENRITFSLQHLLGIQSAFQEASHNDLDPLVWIFMFLKDACRVYAGIIDDSNLVRVPVARTRNETYKGLRSEYSTSGMGKYRRMMVHYNFSRLWTSFGLGLATFAASSFGAVCEQGI